jgi:hypothetical protein
MLEVATCAGASDPADASPSHPTALRRGHEEDLARRRQQHHRPAPGRRLHTDETQTPRPRRSRGLRPCRQPRSCPRPAAPAVDRKPQPTYRSSPRTSSCRCTAWTSALSTWSQRTIRRRRRSRRAHARFEGGRVACRSTRRAIFKGPPLAVVVCQARSSNTPAATRQPRGGRSGDARWCTAGAATGAGDVGGVPVKSGADQSPADDPHASGPSGRSAIAFFP